MFLIYNHTGLLNIPNVELDRFLILNLDPIIFATGQLQKNASFGLEPLLFYNVSFQEKIF